MIPDIRGTQHYDYSVILKHSTYEPSHNVFCMAQKKTYNTKTIPFLQRYKQLLRQAKNVT